MTYIIDYENVAAAGFEGHTLLEPDDEVIVFLTSAHKKINTNMITNSKAAFRFIEIQPNGHKNYMDFQIVALCAKLVSDHKRVAIVSNDGGYSSVKDFFHNCVLLNENIDIKLVSNLRNDPVEQPIPRKTQPQPEENTKTPLITTPSAEKPMASDNQPTLTLDNVINILPLTDDQRKALNKIIKKANAKSKSDRLKEKEFVKKLNFIPGPVRSTCIHAILPYVKLK